MGIMRYEYKETEDGGLLDSYQNKGDKLIVHIDDTAKQRGEKSFKASLNNNLILSGIYSTKQKRIISYTGNCCEPNLFKLIESTLS